MTSILSGLADFIQQIILMLSYPGVALVMFAENVFPPIPSELIMPFAGFLAAKGEMNFIVVIAAGTVGSVLGALVLYGIGLWMDENRLRGLLQRYGKWIGISVEDLDRAMHLFHKYGPLFVFFGRLVPIVRSIISIPAGMSHMPVAPFLLYTTIGSLIWNTALATGGLILGENWENVMDFMKQYEHLVLGVVAVGAVVYIGMRLRARFAPRSVAVQTDDK
jgi:membrane protein DedA with SNARE-associated domain